MPRTGALPRRALLAAAIGASLALIAGPASMPARAAPDEAAGFVRVLIDHAIEVLRLPSNEKAQREAGFRDLLVSNFDLPLITRLVVGRYWRQASEDQQREFASAFEAHIVKVYTSQLGAYEDEHVEIRNVIARTDRDTIVTTDVIRQSDPPLRIDWLVRDDGGGGYKVIDVAAEGVSMMTTKRSEFSSVIAREGLDGLIGRLKDLNARGGTEVGES
ncbi:MAG TPA: ABC transporter substrate-binding protein [Alphaproteobacteria bacterium]